MSNKLTSLTGFGEGDPKPERKWNEPGHRFEHSHKPMTYKEKLGKSAAKSSALNKKMGKKGTADYINAERKSQGYKPMSAKDKRIHEGMDKYL